MEIGVDLTHQSAECPCPPLLHVQVKIQSTHSRSSQAPGQMRLRDKGLKTPSRGRNINKGNSLALSEPDGISGSGKRKEEEQGSGSYF